MIHSRIQNLAKQYEQNAQLIKNEIDRAEWSLERSVKKLGGYEHPDPAEVTDKESPEVLAKQVKERLSVTEIAELEQL